MVVTFVDGDVQIGIGCGGEVAEVAGGAGAGGPGADDGDAVGLGFVRDEEGLLGAGGVVVEVGVVVLCGREEDDDEEGEEREWGVGEEAGELHLHLQVVDRLLSIAG